MIKWMGALFVVAATTAGGFRWAKQYSERPRQLRQLKTALQALEAEIMYGLTPLGEACTHLAMQFPDPLRTFFQIFSDRLQEGSSSVQQAWEESIKDIWPQTALGNGEREVMRQFGATLGKHDRDHQQKQIRLTLSHLEREEAEAKDAQYRNEKMIKSLGFLAGLLIILLLI
ncbi:MAG TPA: stage III sporulation protein SpoIIIAB [Bacillales bacterium]|nr:stage III sporulation protein SpoIIIAB [Bacillales bacterium]